MKVILIFIFGFLVVGCQSLEEVSKTNNATASSYRPDERKEYIFKEVKPFWQKYPIKYFCKEPDYKACQEGINYDQYVGSKFYYTSKKPVKVDKYKKHDFYKIRVDTGEIIYHYRERIIGSSHASGIRALREKITAEKFNKEPIVNGSSVMLTGIQSASAQDGRTYKLSNGDTISQDQLDNLRDLSGMFEEKKGIIADRLINVRVEYDRVEDKYFVKPYPDDIGDTYAFAYIGYRENNKPWLRFELRYTGGSWLFVDKIMLVADNYRLETGKIEFERDHSGGTVWEWTDIFATDNKFNIALSKIANADQATIRFIGDQYYRDFDMENEEKKNIRQVLEVYQAMTGDADPG